MHINWHIGTITVIFLILLTRVQLLWETYFHSDEALFALSARIWQGSGIPYVSWVETKPLGVYCFYAFASWIAGSLPDINMRAVHVFYLLWTGLTAWVIGWIACRLGSHDASERHLNLVGWLAAIFFVLFSTFWDPSITSVSIEVVLLLPLVLSIALLPTEANSQRIWRSFLSGLCVSAAFLCKYQAGIMLPVIFLYFGPILWISSRQWRLQKVITHSLAFLLGFAPLLFLMIGYLHRIGAWNGFFFWNFFGNYLYIQQGNSVVHPWQIVAQVVRHIASTGLLWYLTLGLLIRSSLQKEKKSPYEWLLWIWLFLSFIPVSAGKRFEDHYFLFLIPPLSIFGARALIRWSPERQRRWRGAILTALLLPTMGFTMARYCVHPLYKRLHGEDMNSYKPYATYLHDRTNPGDRLFVWGCAPAIYLFADRLPASRFLRTDVLAGRVGGIELKKDEAFNPERFMVPEAWEMFFDDMKRFPPAYIMDTAPTGLHDFLPYPMTNYPRLMEFVRQHYIQEPSFLNAAIYRRKS